MVKKIGLVDYTDYISEIYLKLFHRGGYKLYYARRLDELESQVDIQELDVLLVHPGIDQQRDVIQLALRHPEKKIAIVTFLEEDYTEGEIPVFSLESYEKF